ncbi:MAG: transcription antitermination factor NusB [Nitrospinota bacterium]
MRVLTREAAVKLLVKTLNGGYSNYIFESFINKHPEISESDTRFLKALYFGILRKMLLLDRLIGERCKSPYEKLPLMIKMILRAGFYQLLFMESVPARAAVHESVELAKKYGHRGTVKLVNALLRGADTDLKDLTGWITGAEGGSVDDIADVTSHPVWLAERYMKNFGREKGLEILKRNNEIPPQNFRVRNNEAFELAVTENDMNVVKNRFNCLGVEITGGGSKPPLNLLRDGIIAPQDQSSLIAVSLMKGVKGRVLELCCGRGNKSEAMLEFVDDKAVIVSGDSSASKLKDLGNLGKERINPVCIDVTEKPPFSVKFDAIFLDAPCSNLGTVRRHPEIKYRRSPEQITRFAEFQLNALLAASESLAPGGLLVYSVCSIEPEETTGVIKCFVEKRRNFAIDDIGERRTDLESGGLTDSKFLRILPGTHGMDGFFAAILRFSSNGNRC